MLNSFLFFYILGPRLLIINLNYLFELLKYKSNNQD